MLNSLEAPGKSGPGFPGRGLEDPPAHSCLWAGPSPQLHPPLQCQGAGGPASAAQTDILGSELPPGAGLAWLLQTPRGLSWSRASRAGSVEKGARHPTHETQAAHWAVSIYHVKKPLLRGWLFASIREIIEQPSDQHLLAPRGACSEHSLKASFPHLPRAARPLWPSNKAIFNSAFHG